MPTKTLRPARSALSASLVLLALSRVAGAQPATAENERILTPSVSETAPEFGGKAVVQSTPGKAPSSASPAIGPGQPTLPGQPLMIEPMPPAPLPVPGYGSPEPYTRDVVTGGDVLTMPDGGTVTTQDTVRRPVNVPRKGSTMAQVRATYGAPQSEYKTGGGSRAQPPITRWTYASFNVVFEYTHVVDVVVPGAPPPLVRTGGLSRQPIDPANPEYKGTPGRALRLRTQ